VSKGGHWRRHKGEDAQIGVFTEQEERGDVSLWRSSAQAADGDPDEVGFERESPTVDGNGKNVARGPGRLGDGGRTMVQHESRKNTGPKPVLTEG